MEFVMVILLVIAFIAICIVSKKAKRKRLIEELKQLILACDTEKVPFERVEYFCRENDFTDTEYHEIRKNLYYELANEDDIHALDMAAAYAQNENRAKEINYRIRAAKLGHVWSMHYLGLIYAYGEEYVQFRDSKKSFYWFSKAAELGDEDSVVHVARAYELGEGVEKDEEKAFNIITYSHKL